MLDVDATTFIRERRITRKHISNPKGSQNGVKMESKRAGSAFPKFNKRLMVDYLEGWSFLISLILLVTLDVLYSLL